MLSEISSLKELFNIWDGINHARQTIQDYFRHYFFVYKHSESTDNATPQYAHEIVKISVMYGWYWTDKNIALCRTCVDSRIKLREVILFITETQRYFIALCTCVNRSLRDHSQSNRLPETTNSLIAPITKFKICNSHNYASNICSVNDWFNNNQLS